VPVSLSAVCRYHRPMRTALCGGDERTQGPSHLQNQRTSRHLGCMPTWFESIVPACNLHAKDRAHSSSTCQNGAKTACLTKPHGALPQEADAHPLVLPQVPAIHAFSTSAVVHFKKVLLNPVQQTGACSRTALTTLLQRSQPADIGVHDDRRNGPAACSSRLPAAPLALVQHQCANGIRTVHSLRPRASHIRMRDP
jgi:hypothetical protein